MTNFKVNNGTPAVSTAKLLSEKEYSVLKKKGYAVQPFKKGKQALISTQPRVYVVATYIYGNWMSQLKSLTGQELTELRKKFTE